MKNKDDFWTNYLFISPDSIGCPSSRGKSKLYGMGKTLVHEMGHVLGLLHPFDTDEWVVDTPPQEESNLNCDLKYRRHANKTKKKRARSSKEEDDSETTWTAYNVNNTYYNSLPESEREINSLSLGYGEMFCNFMDYTPDKYMWMFTRDQAMKIRCVLISPGTLLPTILNSAANFLVEKPTPILVWKLQSHSDSVYVFHPDCIRKPTRQENKTHRRRCACATVYRFPSSFFFLSFFLLLLLLLLLFFYSGPPVCHALLLCTMYGIKRENSRMIITCMHGCASHFM